MVLAICNLPDACEVDLDLGRYRKTTRCAHNSVDEDAGWHVPRSVKHVLNPAIAIAHIERRDSTPQRLSERIAIRAYDCDA